jgi:hypothetical protein
MGQVRIGATRRDFNAFDAAVVAGLVLLYDLIAGIVITYLTRVGGIVCSDTGCDPPPAQAIHRAAIGLFVFVIAMAVPIIVMLVWRRAIVVVLLAQLIVSVFLIGWATKNLDHAHNNLREICSNAPELAHTRCPG